MNLFQSFANKSNVVASYKKYSEQSEPILWHYFLQGWVFILFLIFSYPDQLVGNDKFLGDAIRESAIFTTIYPEDKSSRDCDPSQKIEPDVVNIVANGYFESDYSGWFSLGSPTLSLSELTYASGCKSLLISNRTETWESAALDVTALLDENTVYRFAVWAKSSSLSSTSFNITLKIEGSAGTEYLFPAGNAINNSTWTKLQGYARLDYAGTISAITLYFQQGGSEPVDAEFYIDEVIIEEVVPGNNYFVSSLSGTPGNTGKSLAHAWQSVSDINSFIFQPGDTLSFQRNYTYTSSETIMISGNGNSGEPVLISATGEGNNPVLMNNNASPYVGILSVEGSYFEVSELEFANSNPGSNIIEYGLRLNGEFNTVHDVEISGCGYGILVSADHQTISDVFIHDLIMIVNDPDPTDNDYGAIGVLIHNSSDVTIQSSLFQNLQASSYDYGTDGAAIEFFKNVSNVSAFNNKIEDCEALTEFGSDVSTDEINNIIFHHNLIINNLSQTGYFHNGSGSNFTVIISGIYFDNNTFFKNSAESNGFFIGFQEEPDEDIVFLRNNIIAVSNLNNWSYNAENVTRQNNLYDLNNATINYTLDASEISPADPLFSNPSNNDFTLSVGSPAIDAGTALGYNQDFNGINIPQGVAFDIGAMEHPYTWTAFLSKDWNNAGNWSLDAVPDGTSHVVIPAGTSDYPEISNTFGNYAIVENLMIEDGASINILPDGCLSANETITNQAGASGLIIESSASGTGSLIHNSTGVIATVQRYISAWTSDIHGWHFLSSPVLGQAIQPEFVPNPPTSNQDFFKWDEATATWINSKMDDGGSLTWNPAFETEFALGRGYLTAYDSDITKSFAQTINVEDVSLTNLSRSGGDYSGWHLLGNPFSSAIKWNDGNWNMTNIAGTAKIWNESNASYTDISANGIIPAMNGFMVQVTEGSGSLTIPSASRTHDDQNWYKNSDIAKIKLLVKDLDQNTAQESTILFHPEATEGIDPEFDSRFLAGYAPQFYSISGDENLSVNALNSLEENTEIPFYFIKNESISFEICLTENSSGSEIFIEDTKTGENHRLHEYTPYAFSSETGDDPARFLLSFGNTGFNILNPDKVNVRITGNQLNIDNSEQAKVEVYTLSGQLIFSDFSDANFYQTTIKSAPGIYILKIQKPEFTVNKKIYLKN